jgi:hypothetical protein
MHLLDHLVPDRHAPAPQSVSRYMTKIARLGGHLVRANDPERLGGSPE